MLSLRSRSRHCRCPVRICPESVMASRSVSCKVGSFASWNSMTPHTTLPTSKSSNCSVSAHHNLPFVTVQHCCAIEFRNTSVSARAAAPGEQIVSFCALGRMPQCLRIFTRINQCPCVGQQRLLRLDDGREHWTALRSCGSRRPPSFLFIVYHPILSISPLVDV